jgi:3-(3-hydroxy-phenyl)propionate hydroxylase
MLEQGRWGVTRTRETEVLVVGAGPVGLLTALGLARRNVAVTIIDDGWRPSVHAYATALHPRSVQVLAGEGAVEILMTVGKRVPTIAFYEGTERVGELGLEPASRDYPFALAVPQSALENALTRALAEHKVKVRWEHRLAALETRGDVAVATVERLESSSGGYAVADVGRSVAGRETIEARFVVGADGFRSEVRNSLGVALEPSAEPCWFAVFEFATSERTIDEVCIVLGKGGAALWPLGERRYRWTFALEERPKETRADADRRSVVQIGPHGFPHLAEERLHELIAARAPWFTACISAVAWSLAIRFGVATALSFGRGNTWLAGDAAHIAHPLVAHSMNAGLVEAQELASALAEVLRSGAPPERLETYGTVARARWRALVSGSFTPGDGSPKWVTTHAGALPLSIPASGDDLSRLLSRLGLSG